MWKEQVVEPNIKHCIAFIRWGWRRPQNILVRMVIIFRKNANYYLPYTSQKHYSFNLLILFLSVLYWELFYLFSFQVILIRLTLWPSSWTFTV